MSHQGSNVTAFSEQLARWAQGVQFDDLPAEVVRDSKYRVLDVIGLTLAGHGTPFGRSVRQAISALYPQGEAHFFGCGTASSVSGAAFVNGALAEALEFDETHNRSLVHMSSPAVAAALAIAESRTVSGRDLITALAIGNEISCRIGSISPQQFHKRGFHPTALFAPFGATYLAGKLYGLDVQQLRNAAGICGSFASGLLACWVDGTQTKFLHPGWAAQSGIHAAMLAGCGTTGPAQVIEGRFGLMESHLQSAEAPKNYEQLVAALGEHWESQSSSFKPYPVAHVIHPYIDAILRLRQEHGIEADQVEFIECPIAPYQVGVFCEPLDEKHFPRSDSHGRVSLQFTLAEALVKGRIDRHSYAPETLADPFVQAIAQRVRYLPDPSYPGPERFQAEVRILLRDGRLVSTIEEHNRGSKQNPMSEAEILGKFHDNASDLLNPSQRDALIAAVMEMDTHNDAGQLVGLTVGGVHS
ncbi:MmgE/PrpD family protein [Azotobacter salinestris]|uniref:MmgE/PrpD family protein n=1 Tax=Azotobacter salinestris TaxID=69964 RepID=UPI0012669F39|nr:MmgE/PrpD family protein [Azotobacter salinestris]